MTKKQISAQLLVIAKKSHETLKESKFFSSLVIEQLKSIFTLLF